MRRVVLALGAAGLSSLLAAGAGAAGPELRFLRDDVLVRQLDLSALRAGCTERTITVEDPYYEERRTFLACPLRDVLALGFGEPVAALAGHDIVLRALDGYARPAAGAQLGEDGAYLAFADATRGQGFAPFGPRHIDPGPFYLVWTGAGQRDPHRYPWPYQLAAVEVTDLGRRYPHIVPRTAPPSSAAWRGFEIFRTDCVSCHAINREGGTVGPDLNLPQSIVEYRPVEQLKAYIRDPGRFRYGAMPSHEYLSADDLDALIAYFRTMSTLKHDPKDEARADADAPAEAKP